MKRIPLTQGQFALVDDEDFEYLSQFKWNAYFSKKTWYAKRGQWNGTRMVTIRMHREIAGVTDPAVQVDHEDRNGLNNQRYNLRKANSIQNGRNRGARAGHKYKGLARRATGWGALIKVDGKSVWLGVHPTAKAAAKVYDAAALKHFGEFAALNFPLPKAA